MKRDPSEYNPTGFGAFVQGMVETMFPTLWEDTEVSLLKGIQDGIVNATVRRWAPMPTVKCSRGAD